MAKSSSTGDHTVTPKHKKKSTKKKSSKTTSQQRPSSSVASASSATSSPPPSSSQRKSKKQQKQRKQSLEQQQHESLASTAARYKGFRWLQLALHPSDDDDDKDAASSLTTRRATRHIYYKQHAVRRRMTSSDGGSGSSGGVAAVDDDGFTMAGDEYDDDDAGEAEMAARSLFVVNIPFDFDDVNVSNVFSVFGRVALVLLSTSAGPVASASPALLRTQSAVVVYDTVDSVTTALTTDMRDVATVQPYERGRRAVGVARWVAQYHAQRPAPKRLQQQVDRFMTAFDERERAERAAFKGNVTDEDGWTTVHYASSHGTSGKRKIVTDADVARARGITSGGFDGLDAATRAQQRKAAKKQKVMDFYKFQARQKKVDRVTALQQKFAQDRAKVAALRGSRSFNPFAD